MATVLVTGSGGQLGSELARLSGRMNDLKFIFTSRHSLDVTNEKNIRELFNAHAIDYCVNCAAYTAVDKAESDPANARRINADAVSLLATACSGHHAVLVHISTDYVWDGTGKGAYTEPDAPNPQCVYGSTKWEGEKNALDSCSDTIIIRTSWLYSSFGNNFVKTMMRLAREKKELRVVSDQKGSPTYAGDLAEAIITIIRHSDSLRQMGKSIPSGIYNYSNEGDTTWYGFAKEIIGSIGSDTQVMPISTAKFGAPARRPANSVMSKAKIKKTFGLQIPAWEDGLSRCLQSLSGQAAV